jgi:hypothetical protein
MAAFTRSYVLKDYKRLYHTEQLVYAHHSTAILLLMRLAESCDNPGGKL